MVMSDFRKRLELRDVENIETWWSYDFQASSPEMSGEGGTGKSVGMANKIKIFAKISAKNEVGFLYEQIYLSDKFPNNHTYSYNASVDKERLFKVWDLDKCLSQLKLIST